MAPPFAQAHVPSPLERWIAQEANVQWTAVVKTALAPARAVNVVIKGILSVQIAQNAPARAVDVVIKAVLSVQITQNAIARVKDFVFGFNVLAVQHVTAQVDVVVL